MNPNPTEKPMRRIAIRLVLAFSCFASSGILMNCRYFDHNRKSTLPQSASVPVPTSAPIPQSMAVTEATELVLSPLPGDTKLDAKIARLQKDLRGAPPGSPRLEELGWLFIAKARVTFDQGFYRYAENCALLLDAANPGAPAGLLLKGHVLESMHRFAEAESAARALVSSRGLAFDYGLLGDALMEQGRLDSALSAYQKMMDIKPGFQAYTRAAHMRWLYGDVDGAADMLGLAIQACSPRDEEALAWAYVKLAGYRFQQGRRPEAEAACRAALGRIPGFAPALLMQGRILLSKGTRGATTEAIAALSESVRANPLPEGQWALSDALREAGRDSEADRIDTELTADGARKDPRTFALYLATRKQSPSEAKQMADRERIVRSDIFTYDALAWTHYAAGETDIAQAPMDSALAHGTRDARLFLHAGTIDLAAGHGDLARQHLLACDSLRHMLLPSEGRLLKNALERLPLAHRPDGRVADAGQQLR